AGQEFDTKIYPTVTNTFGSISYDVIKIYVDYIDGAGGTGGYYPANPVDGFYVDSADFNGWEKHIMAHEFQHLIHYLYDSNEDSWVNEGLSEYSAYAVYGPGAMVGTIYGFELEPDNDLTVFDAQPYDYGSAYAFIKYIADHYGNVSLVKDIVKNSANGITGITNALASRTTKSFTQIFTEWTIANYVDDTSIGSGEYGYPDTAINVKSKPYTSFPVSDSDNVKRWAADYFFFAGDKGELVIGFDGSSGSFKVNVVKIRNDSLNFIETIVLDGSNDGSLKILDFGSRYIAVVLIVTGTSSGGNYRYSASIIDRTPPITTISINPSKPNGYNGWYIKQPTISLQANEPATIYYSWDNSTEVQYTSQFLGIEGEHALCYYGVDKNGNKEEKKWYIIKVDTIQPKTYLSISPKEPDGKNGWYKSIPSIELSSEEGSTIYFHWDMEEKRVYKERINGIEGKHILFYYSKDIAGNIETENSVDISVDSIPPIAFLTLEPAMPDGENGYYITNPRITVKSNEEGEVYYSFVSNGETIFKKYDGEIIGIDGNHKFIYYAVDKCGNEGIKNEIMILVDTLKPETNISLEPEKPDGNNDWYISLPKIELTCSENATIYYSWDDEDFSIYTDCIFAPEGINTLYYYSIDIAGNRGEKKSFIIMIDLIAPKTKISVSPDVKDKWYTKLPKITLSSEENAKIYYQWDEGKEN
ncbi:MAG: hypothetical protein AB1779_11835, partial [Candidatus Thermoplasmatota archaeon]